MNSSVLLVAALFHLLFLIGVLFIFGVVFRRIDSEKRFWYTFNLMLFVAIAYVIIPRLTGEHLITEIVVYVILYSPVYVATVAGYLSPPRWFERFFP